MSLFRTYCVLGGLLLPSTAGLAATLNLTTGGIQVEAAGLGKSTIEYPQLVSKEGAPAHKISETSINGQTAVIKYDGGGQIIVDVSDPTQIVLKSSGLSADVQSFATQTVVDWGTGPNRKWKMGAQEGLFPSDKPAKPHLYQGNSRNFALTNYENRVISLTLPDYSYQELMDAREWNWNAVLWKVIIPAVQETYIIQIAEGVAGEIKKVTLVDSFGQSTQSTWPLKVNSEAELLADVQDEKKYYASFKPPVLGKYGGLPGSREKLGLQATGFFHTEQKNGKWLLVDPEGNAFFHLGVCVFGPGDDYTTVKGREQIFEAVPPYSGVTKSAYRAEQGDSVVSFHLANMIRKYGEPYELDTYAARMIDRTRQFGFNSIGAFSSSASQPAAQKANFPYVSHLPLDPWAAGLQDIPGITRVWDPFDESNQAKVEKFFASWLPPRADDPLNIGYFLTNEALYEDIPKVVPTLKGNTAAKLRLVQMLEEKYKTIDAFNTAWGLTATDFEGLKNVGLAVKTKTASEDMQAYTGLFMETYFKLVTETFRKYDKNHLLIGNRLQSGTINNEQLCRIMGKYLDVVSYNYYTYALDKAALTRIHNWTGGKPMMLTEFYWGAPKESGMGHRQDVASQQERGLAYRNYVEQAAALPFIVGIEWFTLVDQATTGRYFEGLSGESGNTGIFSVADRPYKPMVEEMAKTNHGIYQVWLGERPPFAYDNPLFAQAKGGKKTLAISRTTGPMKIDGIAQNWPGVPGEPIPASRLVMGNGAGGVEGSFKLAWDNDNLYLLANIVDPTPMQNPQTNENLWNGDGLELFVGSEKVGESGPMLFTDRQILIGAGKDGQIYFTNSTAQVTQVPAQSVVVPGVDGKSYTIEAAIPWSALSVKPVAGLELQFDLGLDDGSGKGRERQLMWNGTDKNSGDRSNWGRAKLLP